MASRAVSAGAEEAGETKPTPAARPEPLNAPMVSPVQSAPTAAVTVSVLITRSAAAAAAAAADRVINTETVTAAVGALCTGDTIGAFNGSGLAAGVGFVSPASSAPALTALEANDPVFPTTPPAPPQGVTIAHFRPPRALTAPPTAL
ncbi:hypothetical protein VE25_03735, partial [Devosia geojensis]